jgi:hypothetical protein
MGVNDKHKIEEKHDIAAYSKLAEAANFYLDESFHYINSALVTESSSILFSQKLETIEPTSQDEKILKDVDLTMPPISLLQSEIAKVLTQDTLNKISFALNQAQLEAEASSYTFAKSHTINSIELLGHLNCFAFFIETLTNRHLLFLKQSDKLDNFTYSQLALAKILNRLVYICKEELSTNKIQLNEVAYLFNSRNKTVHYTPDNAISLKVDIATLFRIWKQTIKLLKLFHLKEKFYEDNFPNQVELHVKNFESRWTKITTNP